MIEINLLPEEFRKKKRVADTVNVSTIDLKTFPVVKIALAACGFVAAIQVFLFVIGVIAAANFNITEKRYKEILPKKQEAESVGNQLERMTNKVSAINELMVKRFSWAKKLNTLSDSMTPGVWLTALEYDEKSAEPARAADTDPDEKAPGPGESAAALKAPSRYLIISGAASSMGEEGAALIGRFIKNLKSNSSFYSDFSDIQLGTIKRAKMEDQEVMAFKITCLFK